MIDPYYTGEDMDYLPYVYSLKFHNPIDGTNIWYIGSRYANSKYNGVANPSDLLVTYMTSSTYVKELIETHGIEYFEKKIRKTFDNAEECIEYERRLLTKLDAKNSDAFINRSNGFNSFYRKVLCEETKRRISEAKKGKLFTDDHKQKLKESHIGRIGKKCSEETKRKMSEAKKGKTFTEEHKQKLKENHKGRTGKKCSPEHLKKMSDNNIKENNPMFGVKHSKVALNKISEASKKMWANLPTLECPHCGKSSKGKGALTRFHFDNCKLKH